MMVSPYRMGLTATPERDDGRHVYLRDVVGPILVRLSPSQLAGKYLAEFKTQRIYVELTPEEREKYQKLREKFTTYLKKKKNQDGRSKRLSKVYLHGSKDKEAREALLAWNESLRIAINSESKLIKLREILRDYNDQKIIVFTRDVDMAYRVSRSF